MDTKQKQLHHDHISEILLDEKKELAEILESIKQRETLAQNVNDSYDETSTFSQRLADKIAEFGGSWNFIIIFLTILLGRMIVNGVMGTTAFDPYPFILLNLVLSSIAALQAPVIMMSQNRQEKRDRLRAENDYMVNLKAELEIRSLHDKIDHLLVHKRDHLIEIQQIQLEILEGTRNQGRTKKDSKIDAK